MIDWVQTHSVFSAVTLDNGKMGKGRGVTPAPSRKPEKQNSLQTSHSHPYSLQRLRRIAFPKPPLFLFRYAVHLLLFSSCHPCSILPGAVIRAAVILRWHFGESVAAVRVSLAATAREQRQRNRCEAIGRLSERSMPNCLRTFFFCPSFFFPLPIQHMIKAHGQLRFISTETGRAGPQKMWGPIHFKLSLSLSLFLCLSLSLSLSHSISFSEIPHKLHDMPHCFKHQRTRDVVFGINRQQLMKGLHWFFGYSNICFSAACQIVCFFCLLLPRRGVMKTK